MKASELEQALKILIELKRPAMVSSSPGIGKSSIVHKVAKNMGMQIIDLRAGLLDITDLMGIPSIVDGETRWNPPGFFPYENSGKDNGKGIIFLDELPQAAPSVQAAFSQAILDHRVGQKDLDKNWTFVAAGNRMEDRAACHRTPTMISNRLVHLQLELSNDDWHDWALKNEIAVEVINFIKFRPALLNTFNPADNAPSFASPRTWEFASQIVKKTRGANLGFIRSLVMGTVGDGPASEFAGFLQIWRDLPDLNEMFKNPDKCDIPNSSPSVMFALIGAMCEKIRTIDKKETKEAFIKIGRRIPDEFGMLAIQTGSMHNIMSTEGYIPWVEELRKKGLFNDGK